MFERVPAHGANGRRRLPAASGRTAAHRPRPASAGFPLPNPRQVPFARSRFPSLDVGSEVAARPASFTSRSEDDTEAPGPVSVVGGGGNAAPAPRAAVQFAPPAPRCTITTRTLAAAPGGAADTRNNVGINEQVEMTCSATADWTAATGTVSPANGGTVTWTAPSAPGTGRVTATPAHGRACSVTMKTIAPTRRALAFQSDRDGEYTANLAGSAFRANVTIMPTSVCFSRIEVREETVNAVATGYYNTALHWNGNAHGVGNWNIPNASNSGLVDTVGTNPPGSGTPFSTGTFTWAIPQSYRAAGSSGGGTDYSTGTHRQHMSGRDGAETTSKEGASHRRTPT
jgi:hypothetical protein